MKHTVLAILVMGILLLGACGKPDTYTLSAVVSPSDVGSVSPSTGEYKQGKKVTVTATPNSNYDFDHWSGDATGSSATITFTMDSDKSITAHFVSTPPPPNGAVKVHFIDVGQGDAILIDLGETEILIDGGKATPGVIGYLNSFVDGPLEIMVATHPHADHIGGLIAVLTAFEVQEVWHNGDTSTSQTYTNFMSAVEAEGALVHVATRGDEINAGLLTFMVLHPVTPTGSINNNSIVLTLTYGEIDFLFTGDAETGAEASMIGAGVVPSVEILKVGHHGSDTASSQSFLAVVQPETAIYMAGEGNSYGHPHAETISALQAIGASIYGTDVHGTIVIITDADGTVYDVEPTNPVVPVSPPADESTIPDVQIKDVDLQAEVATIFNTGSDPVDMTGWRLVSTTGDQQYTFPAFTLQAGATVQVTSGSNAVDNPPTQLKWTTGYIWNNDGDPAELYDASGNLVSIYP